MSSEIDEIMKKYGKEIEKQVNTEIEIPIDLSREYLQFKQEMMPALSRYEKLCKSLGNAFSIKLAKKDEERVQKCLNIAHLDVTPSQVMTFSIVALLLTFFLSVIASIAYIFIFEDGDISKFPVFFQVLMLITSLFLFYYTYSLPARLANKWRLKASSQMVPCILYIVIYMKHTSNLERAVAFASKHVDYPLSLDFKKIFWDVETGKYSTIKDSIEAYLKTWQEYSTEFVEAFHLIESSLFEPSEDRRVQILERSLQVILDGVYEKMLKYTREIRSPLTNLYMLGIVLPTLGLALLPLASTLLQGMIKWYHVMVMFDIIIPFFVFYLTSEIMLKRPGGYGETEILEKNPYYMEYKSKKPYLIAFFIVSPFLIIGFLPFLFQMQWFANLFNLQPDANGFYDFTLGDMGLGYVFSEMELFDFKIVGEKTVGPFGVGALLLSLLIPFSIALFFSLSYSLKTKQLIKAREQTKKLETEFANTIFQLGNRIGDGLPAEIAFSKVAESTQGQATEGFFQTVNINLHQAGMSLEQSIFNPKRGAIIYYPSALIAMSMRILVESVRKGLQVAARGLMSISDYVKNIQKINERLHDLLAEIVSDMKSNMTFLAPLLAGIVIGLASMINIILNKLGVMMLEGSGDAEFAGLANIGTITQMFDITKMIPPYYLQLTIGIYLIEIAFILTSTLVTVDVGEDKLKKVYDTGRNLRSGLFLYLVVALIAILSLSVLAGIALGGFVS